MNTSPVSQVVLAGKTVLQDKRYFGGFLLLSLLMTFVFIYIPVKTIPGNDFGFQLSIFTPTNFFLMGVLSVLTGLLLAMNVYIFRQRMTAKSAGSVGVGGGSGIMAAIFGTAACSSCVAAIFGFLGAPAVFFLIGARNYIVVGAISLLVISLYFASKNVNKACEDCAVPSIKTKHGNK